MNIPKVIVFDFDLTLTMEHTGGVPVKKNTFRYFNGNEQKLIEMLKFIKSKGLYVEINTRGNKFIITECLNHLAILMEIEPIVGEGLLIESVIGANTSDEIGDPYGDDKFDTIYEKMTEIGIKSRDESSTVWAYKKKEILDTIQNKYNIDKTGIYFFDDTKVNIDCCKHYGYINSFVINEDALLNTIKQINNLL
jgi:FMN phosphatase YigB (HAD superfamily)